MKNLCATLIGALVVLAFAAPIMARGGGSGGGHSSGGSHVVSGHYRSDGTYVAPSHATNPNGTKLDNWSTQGNTNPYTGASGTKSPY